MVRSEKAVAVPGDYQTVFDACLQAVQGMRLSGTWGYKNMAIRSANREAGRITAFVDRQWRADVTVVAGTGQCTVTAAFANTRVVADPFGRVGAQTNKFFASLLTLLAPLVGTPQPEAVADIPDVPVEGPSYPTAPVPPSFAETRAGHGVRWAALIVVLILLCVGLALVLIVMSAALSTPHF